MKKINKLLAVIMAGAVSITGGTLPQKNAVTAEGRADYGISNPRTQDWVTTWDKIKFGSYYQDAEVQPEPIKWRVLSVDGDDAFLLADQILDTKSYNEKGEDVTWETCTLRKWLNEDFYNEAFDDDEKKAVRETIVVNEDNPDYGTEDGNDTKDKVYLLSIAEASNAEYGFEMELNERPKTREAKNTDYAKLNDIWSSTYNDTAGNGRWWLRSPGSDSREAIRIDEYGHDYDCYVYYPQSGVRPALRINLSSSKVEDAGEIDSEGNVTMSGNGISNPIIKDGVTIWDCVYFGSYRQDCSFKKQDIEWRVLSVDGDDAFLLADKNLDAKRYNEGYDYVTWETCTLRKWLNEDFYNESFNDEEKKAIRETTVVNEDNPYWDTKGGNDTKDKIYLLSISETCNAAYGFDRAEFEGDSKTREAKNTDYVKVNNAWTSPSYNSTVGTGYWWLRSPGYGRRNVSIGYEGHGDYYGDSDYDSIRGVRPALHINLSSSSWSKAGEVSSEEQEDDESESPDDSEKGPSSTDNSHIPTKPTQTPTATAKPTPPTTVTQNPTSTVQPLLKQLKLSAVKCAKNTKKITGKVTVSKASVKIKVGKKAYKKASVKGKKFALKLNYRLKKKTKITVKVSKKGYKTLTKSYKVR